MVLMVSFLILLSGTLHQVLPRGEVNEDVEGMQNALAVLVAVVLVGILIATLIAMRGRK
jgi:hypothetical protein